MKRMFTIALVVAIATASFFVSASAGTRNSPSPAEIETAFQGALNALGAGRPKIAIPILRKILAGNPRLARVRLELARALFMAGDLGDAKKQFTTVLSSAGIPGQVKIRILAFLRAIDANQGFSSSLSFSLVAPSGSGRAYATDKVMLNLFGGQPLPFHLNRKQAPATALQITTALRQQWRLNGGPDGAHSFAYIRGTGQFLDAPGIAFDQDRVDIASGVRLTWPRTTASFELRAAKLYYAGLPLDQRLGLGISLERRNAVGLVLFSDIGISHLHSYINGNQDGRHVEVSFGARKSLRGSGMMALALNLESLNANRADYSYDQAILRASRRFELKTGIALEGSLYAELFRQRQATPGYLTLRNEREYGADLLVEKTDAIMFGRYMPFAKFGVSRRTSSVAAFSYREYRVEVGLKSVF